MTPSRPILLGYWPGKRWKQARAVFDRGGLCPTMTAEMGSKGTNFVFVEWKREVPSDERIP